MVRNHMYQVYMYVGFLFQGIRKAHLWDSTRQTFGLENIICSDCYTKPYYLQHVSRVLIKGVS